MRVEVRRLRFVPMLVMALVAAGCTGAMRSLDRAASYAMDPVTLLGSELARFTLSDGTEGSLRRMEDDYSIRLDGYHRVMPLGKLGPVRQIETRMMQGRLVMTFLYVDKRGCVNTRIISIEQPDVMDWSLASPGCVQQPKITEFDGKHLLFTYGEKRYALIDGWTLQKLIDKDVSQKREAQRRAAASRSRVDQGRKSKQPTSDSQSAPDQPLTFDSAPAEKPVVIRLD